MNPLIETKTMRMLSAIEAGMVPDNMIDHPDKEGMAMEIIRWTNDHWRGCRKTDKVWEPVESFASAHNSGLYSEIARYCTVHYRTVRG